MYLYVIKNFGKLWLDLVVGFIVISMMSPLFGLNTLIK